MSEEEILLKYFPLLTEQQMDQFRKLGPVYKEWNNKINVISRKDIDNIYERHVLHSLSLLKVIEFRQKERVLDVGTGGGFPGIPLAILYPEIQFYLIDARAKKIKVVNEVANALGIKNIKAEHKRAEEVNMKFDFVISRAVAKIDKLIGWTESNIKPKGSWIFLKGGELQEELKASGRKGEVYKLSDYFDEPFFETKKIILIQA